MKQTEAGLQVLARSRRNESVERSWSAISLLPSNAQTVRVSRIHIPIAVYSLPLPMRTWIWCTIAMLSVEFSPQGAVDGIRIQGAAALPTDVALSPAESVGSGILGISRVKVRSV